jgi:hypothetical protein
MVARGVFAAKMGKSIDPVDDSASPNRRCRKSAMVPSLSQESLNSAETSSTCGSDSSGSFNDPLRSSSRVQFSNVSIRTYSLTVGDTYVAKPYTLMLDWAHTPTVTKDIDQFEQETAQARVNVQRRRLRGFALPAFLPLDQRFQRLASVTGQSVADLYELESARLQRENAIPLGMCSSDEGCHLKEDRFRRRTYQLVDVDNYQLIEI